VKIYSNQHKARVKARRRNQRNRYISNTVAWFALVLAGYGLMWAYVATTGGR